MLISAKKFKIAAVSSVAFIMSSLSTTVWSADHYVNFLGMDFVSIPAGEYKMGASSQRVDAQFDEMPQHTVKVDSFQMMSTEVTLAQFKRYILESSNIKIVDDDFINANKHGDQGPVVYVSWNDARTFLHWLNKHKPAEDKGVYRLPTEAEWEYACRAAQNNDFCGDNIAGSVAWYSTGQLTSPQAVAKKKPNAFGLYDMSGNAREWVGDCYHPSYEGAPEDAREWTRNCQSSNRVLRGGSWHEGPAAARVTDRMAATIASHSPSIGFRAVREIK